MKTNPVMDSDIAQTITNLRDKAHLYACWQAPQVSRVSEILKKCAEELEEFTRPPLSEYDKLMK